MTGRRIGTRVFSMLGFGLLTAFAVLAWIGARAFAELEGRVLTERALLARLVAERVSAALGDALGALEATTSDEGVSFSEPGLLAGRAALHQLHVRRHDLFDEVFLLAADGLERAHEPAGSPLLDGPRLVGLAAELGPPSFTGLVTDGSARRVFALAPVRSGRGELLGVFGAALRLEGPRLAALLRTAPLGARQVIDLLDGGGTVIASSEAGRLFQLDDAGRALGRTLGDRRRAAGTCRTFTDLPAGDDEVVALCALGGAPWGVAVRQPKAAAYASASELSVELLAAGALLAGVVALFAWGATVSVTRPLGVLTVETERLAAGDLAKPLPRLPPDEVGRLGAAIELMRVALKESLERVERANLALEARVRQRTAELERANVLLKEREEARGRALRKVISAQEDERKRVARELHDETSQGLAALAMKLDSLAATLPPSTTRTRVEEAQGLAVHSLDEVHRIIFDLRPSVLDDLGLASAIKWYAERCLATRGIAVRCELSGPEERLPIEIETAVFRTAQEAMTNIARHGHADSVLVQCTRTADRLTIEIEDDGDGFDVESVRSAEASGRGLGLLGMRERIGLLGGTVVIDSTPGSGTRVALDVPLAPGGIP